IGNVGVPYPILLKPDRLTNDQHAMMKGHTVIADRLCQELRSLPRVRPVVRHHDAQLYRSAYPNGLAGRAMPLHAQITGIVDAFATERPCRRGLTAEAACAELRGEAQRGWRSRDLVEAFIRIAANGDLVERP